MTQLSLLDHRFVSPQPTAEYRAHSSSNYDHVVVLMAGFWVLNLVFFPVWLFASPEPTLRMQAVGIILLWIAVSCAGLWTWLRLAPAYSHRDQWHAPRPEIRQSIALYLTTLVLGAINLVPAMYPLSSSGDEAAHAAVFRAMGRGIEKLVTGIFPGPSFTWLCLAGLVTAALALAWWRSVHSSYRRLMLSLTVGALVVATASLIPVLFSNIDRFMATAFPTQDPAELNALVRFQPLAKFLWLPVSLCCSDSLFALRLPALVCWLLAGVILHHVISLRERSWIAILPPLYLLTLPGMFYYGHLVYLTTPMLLTWCAALYFYECYHLSRDRKYLIWTALVLNVGTFIRLETAYFALAILAHWAWIEWRRGRLSSMNVLLDGAGVAWCALSLVPLWSRLSTARPFSFDWLNWLDPAKLAAIANDYPYHLGLVASPLLIVTIVALSWKRWNHEAMHYSPVLISVAGLTIGISYLLYTADYIVPDARMVGLLPFGRGWQTAPRFLVSWSPFVALLLAEGVAQLRGQTWRLLLGPGLALVLLAQATVWRAPLLLPEYNSVRLRPGAEFPHLPAAEVVTYISNELATPETKILLADELAVGYYLKSLPMQGKWLRKQWMPVESQSIEQLIQHCREHAVNLVILPLVWMDGDYTRLEVSQAVLSHEHFRVKRIFRYLDEPGIVVAEFRGHSSAE